jgi:SAM-dependent methyltransferase
MPPRTRPRKGAQPAPPKPATEIRVEAGVVRRGASAKPNAAPKRASAKKRKAAKKAKRVFTRAGADRHELYQHSVQSPKEDCAFFARVYRSLRKKDARHFREDFCGTALNCSYWVKRHAKNTAEGFDIDPDPVGWGIEHNFAPLGDRARRCTIHLKDVRVASAKQPDVRTATNFSYWCFHDRPTMLEYFRSAHRDLNKDGIFILDIYGGPDAMKEMVEERKIDEGFTYVWDQVSHEPVTGAYKAYIHFRFKDGTELKRAFRYDWRLWGLPEIVDVLREAGFSTVDTYWEGTAADGETGNGVYRRSVRGENCEAWVTYIVAQR